MNRYCPLCNWELDSKGICSNTVSHCSYRGPGLTKQDIERAGRSASLGDTTGDAQNNGDQAAQNYD